MSERQRFRRPDPERTSPIRNGSTLFRASEASTSPGAQARSSGSGNGSPAGPWDACSPDFWKARSARVRADPINEGVRLGYQMTEDYLRQGWRAARKMNNQAFGATARGNDFSDLTERLVRSSADLVTMWLEMLNSILGLHRPGNWSARPGAASHGQSVADAERDTTGAQAENADRPRDATLGGLERVTIEIVSGRSVRASLDLEPGAAALELEVEELRTMAAERPPLRDVVFEPTAEPGLAVRVVVPDDQPPDLYTGIVFDSATRTSRGTLTIRIAQAESARADSC